MTLQGLNQDFSGTSIKTLGKFFDLAVYLDNFARKIYHQIQKKTKKKKKCSVVVVVVVFYCLQPDIHFN
jgi:hypothetical protein